MNKMNLVCVFIIFAGCSVALANADQWALSDDMIASSPLIQHLLHRVEALEQQGAKQADEIQSLKMEVTKQRADLKKLRSKCYSKHRLIQALLNKSGKADKYEPLPGNDEERNADPDTAVPEGSKLMEHSVNRIRRAENETPAAFFASLTRHMQHVGDHQNIVFDHMITNVGDVYNPHHGVFTAPVSGIYVFSTTILPYSSGGVHADLTLNGVIKSSLYSHDAVSHTSASKTMVLTLNQGDDVSIQGRSGESYFGNGPASYTTFSGFLLQQTYPNTGSTPIVG